MPETIHGKKSVFICPNCNMRVLMSPDNDDTEHECNSGNDTVDQEDVPVIGDWDDYSGSGRAPLANMQGIENRQQMSRGGIEGEDVDPVTARGFNKSTHRQRQYIEVINRK